MLARAELTRRCFYLRSATCCRPALLLRNGTQRLLRRCSAATACGSAEGGSQVSCGPVDEPGALRSSLPGTLLEVLVATPRESLRALKGPGGVRHAQVFGDRLHVWSDRTTEADATADFAVVATRAGVQSAGVRAIVPSLEDVFIAKLDSSTETAAS